MEWLYRIDDVKAEHISRRIESLTAAQDNICTHRHHLLGTSLVIDTDFDIGALGLHEFTDHFAELVGIRQLSGSCGRREG